uniref:G-protein coupled receptors family 1 profile domain-containing protein n=1 Tax=Podarcis muralis TaxID=64176 RepID=A0A670ILB5_PODMU
MYYCIFQRVSFVRDIIGELRELIILCTGITSCKQNGKMNHSLFSSNASTSLGPNVTCNAITCLDHVRERKYKFGLGVLMILGTLLGIWFNGTIILLTIKHKFLRAPINYAVVNLSVADMGSIPGFHPPENKRALILPLPTVGLVALWSVVVCAVERYLVVCRPFKGIQFGKKHALLTLLFTWLWCIMWTLPPLFGWSSYDVEGIASNCALAWHREDWNSRSYHLSLFVWCFLLPLALILWSYGKLIYVLKQSNSTQRAETQVTKTVVIMILAFLLSWVPYAAFALTRVVNPEVIMGPQIQSIPMYMAKTGTVYNPVIYICLNKQLIAHTLLFLVVVVAGIRLSQGTTECASRDEVKPLG